MLITQNRADDDGGGIMNLGTLTISNSTISNNSTVIDDGGGIANVGTLTVTRCQIIGNEANNSGGGIDTRNAGASTTISDSTIAANSADLGGGLEVFNSANLIAVNCAISGNIALANGGGGGGIQILCHANFGCTIAQNISNTGVGGGVYLGTANDAIRPSGNSTPPI